MPVRGFVQFDAGRHDRARIGFVLLSSEQTIEDDVMTLRPPGVGVHFSRLRSPDEITRETLGALRPQLSQCAETLIPAVGLDVICYACTSGSLEIGEAEVAAELNRGAPTAKATSLIAGVIRALRTMGAKCLAVGTPYVDAINRREKDYLEAAGFSVRHIEGLGIEKDSDMVRVTPSYLKDFGLRLAGEDVDAVFLSCGALRTLDIVAQVEAIGGRPVICSNQAMMWDTLRLAGIADRIPGYGRLLWEH